MTEDVNVIGVTIDGESSKDLDDAIWVEENVDGWRYCLSVSIANVAFAVKKGTLIDMKASRKGFTRYSSAGSSPMLPRELSEGELSLLPDDSKRVFQVTMGIDKDFVCRSVDIQQTHGKSVAKLNYKQVNESLKDTTFEFYAMLHVANTLAKGLARKRSESGALVMYDMQDGWVCNEDGQLIRLNTPDSINAYQIIQEFMILTNQMVAEYLVQKRTQALYRNHTAHVVASDRDILREDLASMGACSVISNPETLRHRFSLILNRATYDSFVRGHFALNLPVYCHFTSPIRRYADLVNQRILLAVLQNDPTPYRPEELDTLAINLNTLMDQERMKKDEHFAFKRREQGEQLLQDSQIQDASTVEFHRVVRVACENVEPPQPLEDEVIRRLNTGDLPVQDIYFILFKTLQFDSLVWKRIRSEIFSHLMNHKEKAVSTLVMACQDKSIPFANLEYESYEVVGGFSSMASIVFNDNMCSSKVCIGNTLKNSRQSAAVSLIGTIIGVESEKEDNKNDFLIPEVLPSLNTPPSDNFKGRLEELCQQKKWNRPAYEVISQKGSPHRSIFTIVVTVSTPEKRYQSNPCSAGTKKNAEHFAAESVLSMLPPH